MAFIVAVAGKGGVGKTTISSLLIMALADRSKGIVLGIDADPNANLGDKLGVKVERTIGELREELLSKADDMAEGMSKHEIVRYQMELAKVEGREFDLLVMGRPEGPGCYCYINNILRSFIDDAIDSYPYVVIDNEAGLEHLSRRTTKRMDVLVMVSDPTVVGLRTAKRIAELAAEMDIRIKRKILVINRVKDELPHNLSSMLDGIGFQEVMVLPEDEAVERLVMEGVPMTDLPKNDTVFRRVTDLANSL